MTLPKSLTKFNPLKTYRLFVYVIQLAAIVVIFQAAANGKIPGLTLPDFYSRSLGMAAIVLTFVMAVAELIIEAKKAVQAAKNAGELDQKISGMAGQIADLKAEMAKLSQVPGTSGAASVELVAPTGTDLPITSPSVALPLMNNQPTAIVPFSPLSVPNASARPVDTGDK